MTKVIKLELEDEVYEPLAREAKRSGQTPEQWILSKIGARPSQVCELTPEERSEALARLLRHCGAVSVPDPTGADNEAIDRDLADEYASTHDEES